MEPQGNTQPGPPIHDEITVCNSDSDQEVEHVKEAENVKVENEKNILMSYESVVKSPKLNVSNDANRPSTFKPALPRPKPTEWDIVTHVKLSKDVKVPLQIHLNENDDLNNFYGFSQPELDTNEIVLNMLSMYDRWRIHYNDVNGFNKVDENSERADGVNIQSKDFESEEKGEYPREKTPDITDDNDFPSLVGSTRSLRSSSVANKPSSSKQIIEIEDFEEKEDPDDQDFVPSSQTKKRNNKKTVYKKASESIFDFNETATAWQSTVEVASPASIKRVESKSINKPEPAVKEDTIACPICNKLFPMSEIENHASDCLSFEDSVQPR